MTLILKFHTIHIEQLIVNEMSSKITLEMKFAKPGDAAPQFVSRDASDQQNGVFSVQMSLFMGKVYCHLQSKFMFIYFIYSHLSNFSAIRRLPPLPVTGLQI
jgi:hypothetical protein